MKITIVEGNFRDKDEMKLYFVKGPKGDKGDKGQDGTGTKLSDLVNDMGFASGTEIDNIISQRILQMYPIGSLYFTANNINPSTFLGGYWEQVAEGQFFVGVGTYTDMNDVEKTFIEGENAGVYEHSHASGDMYAMANPTGGGINYANKHRNFNSDFQVTGAGGSKSSASVYNENAGIALSGNTESENNTGPSFGLYAWQRKEPPVGE